VFQKYNSAMCSKDLTKLLNVTDSSSWETSKLVIVIFKDSLNALVKENETDSAKEYIFM